MMEHAIIRRRCIMIPLFLSGQFTWRSQLVAQSLRVCSRQRRPGEYSYRVHKCPESYSDHDGEPDEDKSRSPCKPSLFELCNFYYLKMSRSRIPEGAITSMTLGGAVSPPKSALYSRTVWICWLANTSNCAMDISRLKVAPIGSLGERKIGSRGNTA